MHLNSKMRVYGILLCQLLLGISTLLQSSVSLELLPRNASQCNQERQEGVAAWCLKICSFWNAFFFRFQGFKTSLYVLKI